jgi:hypothetical protein
VLTPSSVVVGSALSCGTCVLLLAMNMVVLNPAGPSVPYMPTLLLPSPLDDKPAKMLGATSHNGISAWSSSMGRVWQQNSEW